MSQATKNRAHEDAHPSQSCRGAHKAFGSKTLIAVREFMSDRKARTAREIGDAIGLRDTAVSGVMRLLETKKQAYIVDWPLTVQGKPAAQWKLGRGKSVPRPPTKAAIGGHAWRQLHAARALEAEPQPWHETFRPFRDPLTTALFGEYRSAP